MTTHWTRTKAETTRTLLEAPNYVANGTDFIINYIGNSSYRFNTQHKGIYIYENGKDEASISHFTETYVAPTCTTSGGIKQTCKDCGYSYYSKIEDALGHSYGDYTSDGNATCIEDGTKTAACSRCGHKDTLTDIGSAKGHNYSSVTTEATCTGGGYTVHICHCGHSYTDGTVDALGHIWDNGSMTQRPVTGINGEKIYKCARCGEERSEAIPGIPEAGFADVAKEDYFYESVNWAAAKSITSGITAEEFGPAKACTRAQVVTFLWRAAGEPAPGSDVNPFTDVQEGQYYYDAVLWAVEKGITTGLSANTFGPNADCSRGQIVTFLWRAMGKPALTGSNNPFTDVPKSQYEWILLPQAAEKVCADLQK